MSGQLSDFGITPDCDNLSLRNGYGLIHCSPAIVSACFFIKRLFAVIGFLPPWPV
jgi:hypothetical protein